MVGYTFGDLFGGNKEPQKLSTDFFILKLDPNGNQIWSLQDGTPTVDELWSVTTDENNDIYVAGGVRGDLLPSSIRGISTPSSVVIPVPDIAVGKEPESGSRASLGIALDNRDPARKLFMTRFGISCTSRVTSGFHRSITVDNVADTFDDYRHPCGKAESRRMESCDLESPFIFSRVDTDNHLPMELRYRHCCRQGRMIYMSGDTTSAQDKDIPAMQGT